jgi:hypothetical protein
MSEGEGQEKRNLNVQQRIANLHLWSDYITQREISFPPNASVLTLIGMLDWSGKYSCGIEFDRPVILVQAIPHYLPPVACHHSHSLHGEWA